ncbi:PPA1309 family protein [Actinomyces slackii]|uniref:Uncharacterized protein n=1 Tax=Actinomyces slackii TaxID=52774 RepID=A0A3S4SKD8_9ACTO|nr:PPA1309 family protein [Actinomyces slackii]VEG74743.1 Uncharacterised protein [Actinomyces slackii]
MSHRLPPHDDPAAPRLAALARAVVDTEEHVAAGGWDAPARVFALVRTRAALEADPDLADLLDEDTVRAAAHDAELLTVVEQEDLPGGELEDLLAQLAWPHTVDGVALSVERIMLPPAAQEEAIALPDAHQRLAFLAEHPDRQDIRMVVGVLRSGEAWCALRSHSHDSPSDVYQGADLVPGLIEALASTLD